MGPVNVRIDGWETCATSAFQATSGPSARRCVIPRRIAANREHVSGTGSASAWIHTSEQTAAGVEMASLVRIASMSAGQSRAPIEAAAWGTGHAAAEQELRE